MASKTERTVVNAAGLVQGIVLVRFPAASTIFTSKSEYGLSSSQYGAMFLPQVAPAIAAGLRRPNLRTPGPASPKRTRSTPHTRGDFITHREETRAATLLEARGHGPG